MVDILGGLSAATQAISLARDLRDVDKAVDAAAFKLKIADLTEALADIKLALAEAKEELTSKDAEIERLKKQFQRSANTVEFEGLRYDKGVDGKPRGAAYCAVCEQKSGLLFHLVRREAGADICPNCNARYRAHKFAPVD